MPLLPLIAYCIVGLAQAPQGAQVSNPYNVPNWPTDPKHAKELERDIETGKKSAAEVKKQLALSNNLVYIARVQRVGRELAKIADATEVDVSYGDKRLNPFPYHFDVIANKDIQAFSLPGGNIYVYEGLLKYVESDDELAGVLAHEIAHAAFRHVATLDREQKKMQLVTLPLILISLFTHNPDVFYGSQLIGLAKGSGWSVRAEEAADYGGFQYMVKSKFNPVGMLTFMERLARDERLQSRQDLGIFQTHPVTRERAEAATQRLQALNIPIKRSLVSKSFRVELKPVSEGVEAWFYNKKLYTFGGDDAKERAEDAAKRLNDFFDSVPELWDVQVRGDAVYGKSSKLIEIDPDDAKVAKTTVLKLKTAAVAQIKNSLFGLAYRVWDGW